MWSIRLVRPVGPRASRLATAQRFIRRWLVIRAISNRSAAFCCCRPSRSTARSPACFGTLSQGGRLCLPTAEEFRDPEALAGLVERYELSHLLGLPSLYSVLVEHEQARLHSLRTAIVAGESCPPRLPLLHYERVPYARLYNEYGPTEGTVWSTVDEISCGSSLRYVSIGSPIGGVQVALLDERQEPVSQGLTGELYIGGGGLSRGYFDRPDFTAERFVPNPFGEAGERLYRTGDLGRCCVDGTIEFIGRVDHQVKIRGFRVELGEIEAALGNLPEIREAVVVAYEARDGEKSLAAYVLAPAGAKVVASELRTALGRSLPDYMVPSTFVTLDKLPLNANGKVDRKALPAPDVDALTERRYIAPRTPAEAALCEAWAEILSLERVGVDDDFFTLGGHSLLAMTLIETLRKRGFSANVRMLFSHPTPGGLAGALGGAGEIVIPPNLIPPGCDAITPKMLTLATLSQADIDRIVAMVPGGAANVQDIYPLAPMQEGILFHHLMTAKGDPYLMPILLSFDSRERLDAFIDALQRVIDRHDILRTAVVWEGLPEPMQVVWRNAPMTVDDISSDVADGDITEQLRERFDPRKVKLDVQRAPMLRGFRAYDPHRERWILELLYHHLIDDNTTLRLALDEAEAYLLGRSSSLPAPVPFRNSVAEARLGSREEHEAFFRTMLGDVAEPTAPFGLLDVQGDGSGINEARVTLDTVLARRLRERARALGVSVASLCHQAFAQVLARASGRDDVVFGTVLFGRLHGGEGADRALGIFINTLPLRIRLGAVGVADAVRRTHESAYRPAAP